MFTVLCKFKAKFSKWVVYQAVFGNPSVSLWSTKAPFHVSVKKKKIRFAFQNSSLKNKGKSLKSSSERKYSCHCTFYFLHVLFMQLNAI